MHNSARYGIHKSSTNFLYMSNSTSTGVLNDSYPSYTDLPDQDDLTSLSPYINILGDITSRVPIRNWCYLSQIIADKYHPLQPSVLVQDKENQEHPIVFYFDNDGHNLPTNISFTPGHTLALLYPYKTTCLDGTQGIRVDHPDCKVFECPLNMLLHESTKIGKDYFYACEKLTDHLMKCGKCLMARYCSRDCQSRHWKVHKSICSDMRLVDNLVH